ncbi:MAG: CorA family divalent cation transporter [Oscillospiraceae bacterium]
MEATEETIASLEDMLATDKKIDYTAEISTLRKRLLKLKRYYESLFDSLVDMEENQNRFLTEGQLRYIHIVTNRADRLLRSVLNLRDYVTQVREAYQAQMDISLNQTMKLFTVITAIFLPLTLIAGWYGLNLAMPEYLFPYSYPIVIGVSLAIAAGCIVYFKKNNWF